MTGSGKVREYLIVINQSQLSDGACKPVIFFLSGRVTMKDERFSKIEGIKQELLGLGYYQFQIDNLVRETVHTIRLEKVSSEELSSLVTALAQHRDFARRCQEN
jgi:hypothetical protein